MKRILLLCIALLCIVPLSSAFVWNISGGSGWSVSAYPENAGNMGDGNTASSWYNAGSGTFSELTWSPSNYYSKARVLTAGGSDEYWDINGACTLIHTATWENLSVSPGDAITMRFYAADSLCITDNPWGRISEIQWENGTAPPPNADFVGVPLNGTAPLTVQFTDTSTDVWGNVSYNWTISPSISGNIGNSGLNRNQTTYFVNAGLYTVSHGIETASGSDIETKTAYINVTNASDLITAYVSAIDQTNGYRVLGADISILDVENASWSNSTADPDGIHQTSTRLGNHLNAYASAYGYTSGENLGISNIFNGVDYAVYLVNENDYNASAGNVTLNIRVEDGDTLQPIAGAGVSATTGGGPGFSLMTDSMGLVNIIVANQTTYNIRAIKTNYIPGTKNINTGNAPGPGAVVPVTILLYKSSVTTAPTVTTGTGGGTVAPTQTYYKYCDPSQPDYNEDACRTSENTGMMDQLREAGPSIIGLCIVAILMGLLKIIMG